ncbi:MAG: hypothetical protein ACI9E1_002073 [Cryomorphaceae bacterium]|jgi:hypothetical protein
MQTFLIIVGIVIVILFIIWWAHRTIRISLCCGTCGCNLVSDKTKEKMLARRAKKDLRKNKACKSCPSKKS